MAISALYQYISADLVYSTILSDASLHLALDCLVLSPRSNFINGLTDWLKTFLKASSCTLAFEAAVHSKQLNK